nr:unnamed protein product [Callosobruchus analis]
MKYSKDAPSKADEQLRSANAQEVPADSLSFSKDDTSMADTRCYSKSLEPNICRNHVSRNGRDIYISERREREMLVSQIVELQSTLSDLSLKAADNIKLENIKLRSDNEVLVHYIENLVYDFNMTH